MAAKESNLSSPKYGYHLVCATTQDAINVTMKQFLSQFAGTEFSSCYTRSETTKKPVETPLETLKTAVGIDPFSIPNGADQTDVHVQALYNNRFLYAFRAKMGIPSGLPPASVPDILILNKGNSTTVSYQMFCAEFEVIVLDQEFGTYTFEAYTQTAASPWIFLFEVSLDLEGTDFSSLPPDVQQRVKNLSGDTAFSVQQLYVDLNTAGMQQLPQIHGLDPTTDAYIELTRVFVNQYWNTLRNGGKGAILGYSLKPVNPGPTPSIIPTDLTLEVSPYLGADGKPTTQYGLYTLNYLLMSRGLQMPPSVPFSWNWVEQNEEANFHGVIAVRKELFRDFLQALMSPDLQRMNYATDVNIWHDGETIYSQIKCDHVDNPPLDFAAVADASPGADGFIPVLTAHSQCEKYDSANTWSGMASSNCNFNYYLDAEIAYGPACIRARLHCRLYIEYHHHEAGINYTKTAQNAVDTIAETTYQLVVTPDGRLHVNPTVNNQNNAPPLSWSGGGLDDTSAVRDYVADKIVALNGQLATATQAFETHIGQMLNGSTGWVYPGGSTFVFKDIQFSDSQDLITHITYADPQ